MQLSVILLFLQLWGHVEVSLSQNACLKPPDVLHAHVSEENRKAEYQEGDVIHFTCEPGYISSQTAKYLCTGESWLSVRPGTCYSCSSLPDVTHAHITEETKKADYQEGDMIHFTCEPGYTSGAIIKYACTSEGWRSIHQRGCYSLGCDPPPADRGIAVKGLPDNDVPIPPNDTITFSCDSPGKYLSGNSVLTCGENGQWDNQFPSCEDITCNVDVLPLHLNVADLPPAIERVKSGHKLHFNCNDDYELEGSEVIECLQTGEWSAPFPTCAALCKVPDVPSNIYFSPRVRSNQVRKGQILRFGCRNREEVLRGKGAVVCLAGGQWSDPFPTCQAPLGCGRPPPLAEGDLKNTLKYQHRHGEAVEYICQRYYTMDGQPYKICNNGEWTGQMRCLRPCTVDKEAMSKSNIRLRHLNDDKIYTTHNGVIEFTCIGYTRHDRVLPMRQRCDDGVIHLPRCH